MIPLNSQQNWLNLEQEKEAQFAYEFPVYTDVQVTGEITETLGPYQFLNAIPLSGDILINAAVVFRVFDFIGEFIPRVEGKTDTTRYHGGDLKEEVLALVSLSLGRRVNLGGESREIDLKNNPLGRPMDSNHVSPPFLRLNKSRIILPDAREKCSLNSLSQLQGFHKIAPKDFVELIRAAKLYQDALWVVETNPNLAWIFLVSSLEIAAGNSIKIEKNWEDQLREMKLDLVVILEKYDKEKLVGEVAKNLAPILSSTKKFLRLIERFFPEEPKNRPPDGLWKLEWTRESMLPLCKKVYHYRSKSLHAGTPFPLPMLCPVYPVPESKQYPEKPMVGKTSYGAGGTWYPKDCPITLHAFHRLTQGVLLNWWNSLL